MKRMILMVSLAAASPLLAAPPQDAIKDLCAKGTTWRIPVANAVIKHPEAPVKIDGKVDDAVRICNCTADMDGKVMGVWVRAYRSDEIRASVKQPAVKGGPVINDPRGSGGAVPFYLANASCVRVSSPTVALASVDNAIESWGTWVKE